MKKIHIVLAFIGWAGVHTQAFSQQRINVPAQKLIDLEIDKI
ncbi:hypothetical protein [Solitalea lacus]|nr:hypothetical protein [Solitalea lacus]